MTTLESTIKREYFSLNLVLIPTLQFVEAPISQVKVAFELTLLTFCPPEPELLENVNLNSL